MGTSGASSLTMNGSPLPGTTVYLESAQFPSRSARCSEGGIFRFINLTPGTYKLRCELAGFKSHVREVIDIRAGTNFDFRITLIPATLEEQVTVVAISPIVDTKKTGTVTNVTQDMLQSVPSARDPWVILQQTPGILVSQENVGGSASGIQYTIEGRAGMTWNNQWNLDGVPITDMVGVGTSSMYYDFDTFQEMTIVTGGHSAASPTGGVSINFVTKRGGNKFQVQARAFFTNDDLQSDNRTQEVKDLGYLGDQIKKIMDYGLQLGGPIKKDRLWFWLGYGVQDVRRLAITGYPSDVKLEGINAKLNFRLSDRNRAELAFLSNSKNAFGRGASAVNPPRNDTGFSVRFVLRQVRGRTYVFPQFSPVHEDQLSKRKMVAYSARRHGDAGRIRLGDGHVLRLQLLFHLETAFVCRQPPR